MIVDAPTIPDYFAGKNVFVTGATGFIGKVLIEKILRSCPEVGNIYVLVRPKKGRTAQERVDDLTKVALFDVVREKIPENLKKIVPIIGDVVELKLGMSPEDRRLVASRAHVIYHIAASVRFDDPLRDAVLANTRGTREVALLAKESERLECLVHFSTTYCHADKPVVEEKIYPALADWRATVELAENADERLLQVLTAKYTHPLPNTYTFTKSLAEHVVRDLCEGEVPAVIFRPSIVISSKKDPFPGWIDNFNGPVGILLASGKGIMRTCYAKPDVIADYVPCDTLVRAVIIATWQKGIEKNNGLKPSVTIYNGSTNKIKPVTMGELVHMGKKLCWETPLNGILWYPNGTITYNWYLNFFRVLFYQLLPAIFIDGLLILANKKPILVKINRKIFIANCALEHFITNEWDFINVRSLALESFLHPSDFEAFSYDKDDLDAYGFFQKGLMGARKYLLKESDESLPKAMLHSRRMWIASQIFNSLWYFAAFYVLYRVLLTFESFANFIDNRPW